MRKRFRQSGISNTTYYTWVAVVWLLFVTILLAVCLEAQPRPTVATCMIQKEGSQKNHRSEIVYYQCDSRAVFAVFADSPGELWLRELVGKTVDIKLEVVR